VFCTCHAIKDDLVMSSSEVSKQGQQSVAAPEKGAVMESKEHSAKADASVSA